MPADDLLVTRLERWAEQRPDALAVRHVDEPRALDRPGAAVQVGYAGLYERAGRAAAGLRTRLRPGDRALLLFSPGLDYVCSFVACQLAGVVAVPLYPPSSSANMRRFVDVATDCTAGAVLTAEVWAQRCADALAGAGTPVLTLEDLARHDPGPPARTDGDGLAFLQYTSGSTGTPRGVMVTHRNLAANLVAIGERFGVGPGDHQASWLPPYHDMGLIAGILHPLHAGLPVTLMSPMEFLRDPLSWLDVVTRFEATYTGAPNFGYAQCTRRATDDRVAALDLGRLRMAFCGSEPISAAVLAGFAARFAPAGFDAAAFLPGYGLAEATLMVSGTAGDGVHAVEVPAPGPGGPVQQAVAVGAPVRDTEVRVVDPDTGVPAPAGTVGEVWVRGPGVAAGYWQDPARTEKVFRARPRPDDGRGPFLRTGDLGFLAGDRLCITGRIKDLLIVDGRNVYPQDIETAAWSADPRLRPGGAAAFAVGSLVEPRIVLVQECAEPVAAAAGPAEVAALAAAVRTAVRAGVGVEVADVVLVPPRAVPRTTSGKVRRTAARQAYEGGGFRRLGAGSTGPAGPGEVDGADGAGGVDGGARQQDHAGAARAATVGRES